MKFLIKIILSLFIFAVIILFAYSWFSGNLEKEQTAISCSIEVEWSKKLGRYAGFGPSNDIELIACYGIITEERWTESENAFSLYDHKNKYEIVALDEQGHYKMNGDNLLVHVIDGRPIDWDSYAVWYFIGGEEKLFTYRAYSNIPKYIAINIYTGEVTIYSNNLEEIPEAERDIFKELEAI